MTDEQVTPNTEAEATPAAQPEPTGTLETAAEEAAAPSESPKAVLATELSAAQLAQVEKAISQAVDGARRTWDEKHSKELSAKGYLTPDQAKAIAADEVQLAEARATAKANISMWLSEAGITSDSEDAKAVFAEYKEGLEAGRYTNKMLLDPKGVGFLVQAAGLGATEKEPEVTFGDPLSVPQTFIPSPEGEAPKNRAEMDRRITQKNQEVISGLLNRRKT